MNGNLVTTQRLTPAPGRIQETTRETRLPIVVPYTTPALTRIAMKHAAAMSSGLNATIRLIDAVAVPIQCPIGEPPVNGEFLKNRLREMAEGWEVPVEAEIVYTRDRMECFRQKSGTESIVVIAVGSLWWPTFERKLARSLVRTGHDVALVSRDGPHR